MVGRISDNDCSMRFLIKEEPSFVFIAFGLRTNLVHVFICVDLSSETLHASVGRY